MSEPRVAKSLETLRAEVNAKWPNRKKDSDGTLAGSAHHIANPNSDHEPWVQDAGVGVVTAMDITHDPNTGPDSQQLAEALVRSQDPRIKYIISNLRICSGSGQANPAWVWRPYPVPPNKNPHNHHVHISVKSDKASYDSTQPWGVTDDVAPPQPGHVPGNTRPTIQRGSTGDPVKRLQALLGLTPVDGRFDEKVDTAVKAAQERAGIVADGVVAPQTWELLEKGQ
ncbi:MAG: hypothetical protein QOH67_1239 [Hyphomicrobiales bacterium]|jgi:murein L,D-transpeptidase YcbB/YkuD|nr:hypothetical protein [Hyphomicrobiales bacterium]